MKAMARREVDRLGPPTGFSMDVTEEHPFSDITRLANTLLGTQSAAIRLIDKDPQLFKSGNGITFDKAAWAQAFCTHAVVSNQFFEVGDASQDPRFRDDPLVLSTDGIRFYAAAPLIVPAGQCIGTLCVSDPKARAPLSFEQRQALCDLASLAAERIEAHRARRTGNIALQTTDDVADGVVCIDHAGYICYWNAAAERIFGYTGVDVLGRSIDIIIPKEKRRSHRCRSMLRSLAKGSGRAGRTFVIEAERASSECFPIEFSIAQWRGYSAQYPGYAAIIRDVTGRQEEERDNAQNRLLLDTIIANLPAMLFLKDSRTRRYQLLNRSGEDLIGLPASEVVGRTDRELFPNVGDAYHERDGKVLAEGAVQSFESDFPRADGKIVRVRTKRIVVDGPEGPGQFILGMSEDVTGIREAEARILSLAHYDSLTGLHNRTSFLDAAEHLVTEGSCFAVLTIDLDRFKVINDQFGHMAGDEVLIEVARRLCRAATSAVQVARVGGDEFTVILAGKQLISVPRIADAIVRSLGEPYQLDRVIAHTGASIGVVMSPDDGGTVSDLRQAADLAMYRAKASGGRTTCFFSPEMDLAARDRRVIEADLRRAIDQRSIHVVYQPVISTATGQITSFEALARWTHPQRGPIPPDLFIPIAEECGLVAVLGELVLETACRDASEWPPEIRVAVNLSPVQFDMGDVVTTVQNALKRTALAPNRLQLEVTEGLVIRDVERVFLILEKFRSLGIQILMDDFGVGYSSLSYFERFPFDKVKIDRSFVAKMQTSPAAVAVIEAVVGLGRRLGMGIVAEGVETEDQMEALVTMGCTHLQGYLISRPRAVEDFFMSSAGSPLFDQAFRPAN